MIRTITPRAIRAASILALAAAMAIPALAQQPLPAPPRQVAQPNAALIYWPAWVQISQDTAEKLRAIDWSQVGAAVDVSSLPEAYRDAAKMDTLFSVAEDLVRASKAPRCDFEIRYDDGFMAILPHLSKSRDGARLLRLAAHQRLTQGNADGAAAYVAALARGAQQLSGDRVLISSLVGFATATSACEETAAVLATGGLTNAGRDELLKALRALDTDDPMNVRATLAFEGQVIPAYLERVYRGPGAGQQLADLFGGTFSIPPSAEKALADVRGLDEAGVKAQMVNVRSVYEQMFNAWNLDADASALHAINEKVSSGGFGPLAQVLCPSLEKAFGSSQKFRATLRATIASVEKYTPAAK